MIGAKLKSEKIEIPSIIDGRVEFKQVKVWTSSKESLLSQKLSLEKSISELEIQLREVNRHLNLFRG